MPWRPSFFFLPIFLGVQFKFLCNFVPDSLPNFNMPSGALISVARYSGYHLINSQIMKRMSDYRALIEAQIKATTYPAGSLTGLYAPIEYALSGGGKRLRPVLTLMVCDAFGGDLSAAVKPALGLEVFHNFTLLHDDVMDASDLRRGKPTVCKKWDTNTAILSGDTMLTLATQLVSEVPDEQLRLVLQLFNKTAIEVYEGQQLDMDFEHTGEVSLEAYLEMIRLKTSVLLGAACKLGAIIAGASAADADAMYSYGEAMGMAFQIQDDYLDLYGDESTFGKPIGGDVINDKKTFLILTALAKGGAGADALKSAMQLSQNELKIKTVRNLLTAAGVPEICREAMQDWSHKAVKALGSSSLDKSAVGALHDVVDKLVARKK